MYIFPKHKIFRGIEGFFSVSLLFLCKFQTQTDTYSVGFANTVSGKTVSPLEMDGRRVRRFGIERGRGHLHTQNTHSLLPLRTTQPHHHSSPPNTISCWYCDYKTSSLNGPLFRLGRKHAWILRAWFSIGVGFGLTALLASSMVYSLLNPFSCFLSFFYHCIYILLYVPYIWVWPSNGLAQILLWELASALHLLSGNSFGNLSSDLLFGFSPFPSSVSIFHSWSLFWYFEIVINTELCVSIYLPFYIVGFWFKHFTYRCCLCVGFYLGIRFSAWIWPCSCCCKVSFFLFKLF